MPQPYLKYLPFPGTGQQGFWKSTRRFPALIGPASIGKTQSGAAKLIGLAMNYPASYIILAPDFHNQMKMATLPKYEALIPREIVVLTADGNVFHKTDQRIVIRAWDGGESVLYFRSAEEPDKFYGGENGGFHIDEAGQVHEKAYESVSYRMRAPGAMQQGIVTYTPRASKKHWTYQLYGHQYEEAMRLMEAGKPAIVDHPTYPVFSLRMKENPTLTAEYLAHAEREAQRSPFARQEYYGEYIDMGGLVYPTFNEKVHVRDMPNDIAFVRIAAGVDFGTAAPTTIIVVGEDQHGRLWCCHEFYRAKCLPWEFFTACTELRARYPSILFFCDPSGRNQIADMRAAGIPAYNKAPGGLPLNDVNARVTRIWGLLEVKLDGLPGMFVTPECVNTIHEFDSWSWIESVTRTDIVRYDQVEPNSHCLDALGYVVVGLGKVFEPMRIIWGAREKVMV